MAPPKTNVRSGKRQTASRSAEPRTHQGSQQVSLKAQQDLLDIYKRTFGDLLSPTAICDVLQPKLQSIKSKLFERDFEGAFGDRDSLRAYAARWSPTRAVAYLQILTETFQRHLHLDAQAGTCRLLCMGAGGGAELTSLCTLYSMMRENTSADITSMHVTTIDVADWSAVLQDLHTSFTASADDPRSFGEGLVFENVRGNLLHSDVLNDSRVTSAIVAADVVTILFTLNELFSESMVKTQALLLTLSSAMKHGGLLLVADSAGSYSTVGLGSKDRSIEPKNSPASGSGPEQVKKYPMAWLLDHVLLKLAGGLETKGKSPWIKLETSDSRWCRLSQELRYPIPLEDMRYQLHVFQHS